MYELLALFAGFFPIAFVAVAIRVTGFQRSIASITVDKRGSDTWREYDMRKRDERHDKLDLYYGLYGPSPLGPRK